jgi:hypothetical protein
VVWLPKLRGQTILWQDYPGDDSDWICIESHVELNTDDGSANGTEELWIDDSPTPDASSITRDMRDTYSQYGINQIAFDNYWNDGSPQANELYRDNIVISTERIYCTVDSIGTPPGATPTPTSTPTATPTDVPPTPTATPTATATSDPSDPTGVLP